MQARAIIGGGASCSSHMLPDKQSALLRHVHRPALSTRGSQRARAVVISAASGTAHTGSAQSSDSQAHQGWRHRLAGGLAAAALSASIAVSPAAAAEPFLTATGLTRQHLTSGCGTRSRTLLAVVILVHVQGLRDVLVWMSRGAGAVEGPGGRAVPVARGEGGPGAHFIDVSTGIDSLDGTSH